MVGPGGNLILPSGVWKIKILRSELRLGPLDLSSMLLEQLHFALLQATNFLT